MIWYCLWSMWWNVTSFSLHFKFSRVLATFSTWKSSLSWSPLKCSHPMWKKLCYCEEEKIVYMGMCGLAISLSLPRKKHCGKQNRSSMSKNLCDGQLRAGYWFPPSSAVVEHQLVCWPEISIKMSSTCLKCLTLIISWSAGLVIRALEHWQ